MRAEVESRGLYREKIFVGSIGIATASSGKVIVEGTQSWLCRQHKCCWRFVEDTVVQVLSRRPPSSALMRPYRQL
jgi:hypothetical protein